LRSQTCFQCSFFGCCLGASSGFLLGQFGASSSFLGCYFALGSCLLGGCFQAFGNCSFCFGNSLVVSSSEFVSCLDSSSLFLGFCHCFFGSVSSFLGFGNFSFCCRYLLGRCWSFLLGRCGQLGLS